MTQTAERPSVTWSRTQNSTWAGVARYVRPDPDGSGTSGPSSVGATSSSVAARSRTVAASGNCGSGTRRPVFRASRLSTEAASSEWPPRSAKATSAGMLFASGRPRTSAHTVATSHSSGLSGAAPARWWLVQRDVGQSAPDRPSRWGSGEAPEAPRSGSGPCSRVGAAAGVRAAPAERRRRRRSARRTPPMLPLSWHPRGRPRPTTRRRGCRARIASISPSSMRKPRIFTWWSVRPR